MATGEKIPMVFFPRFTTISGTVPFSTTPIDMLGFGKSVMSFWAGEFSGGTSPNVTFKVEQSADLNEWTALGTQPSPVPGQTLVATYEPTQRYIRCTATLNENVTVTMWSVGYGERTESQ